MSSQQLDEERIFHTARGISDPEIQSDYLDQICSGDQALRERVEALLEVHEKEQDFLKSLPEPAPTARAWDIGDWREADGSTPQLSVFRCLRTDYGSDILAFTSAPDFCERSIVCIAHIISELT